MGACLEISLCIGILKTRFDDFDEIKLKLKNGSIVEGVIQPMESLDYFYLETENGIQKIRPEEIEDYIV